MHVINLVTVPHTGTNFMKAFFDDLQVTNHIVEVAAAVKNPNFLQSPVSGIVGFRPDRVNLAYGHVYERNMPMIHALCEYWKPIVPVRDPLAQLISRKERKAEENLQRQVETWCRLFHDLAQYEPHYVPLDLLRDPITRMAALEDAVRAAGVQTSKDAPEVCGKWAKVWPKDKHNSRGMYRNKIAYHNHDFACLQKVMGQSIKYLQSQEFFLRPHLEGIGYRNLMWWTGPATHEPEGEVA